MRFLESTPFVRQALHARLDMKRASKDLFQTLQTRDSRLFYILSGKGEMKIEDTVYPLQPDMIFLFKAGTRYEWKISNADYYAVNFDYNDGFSHIKDSYHPFLSNVFSREMTFDCGRIEDCAALEQPLVLYKAIGLKQIIQNIVAESAMTDRWSPPLLSALLKQVILELLRMEQNTDVTETKQNIKQIINYINEHFTEPLTNTAIADEFGYNSTYLGRIFKAHTGNTLHDFITELRIKAAMELLSDPGLPVGEICRQVGIPDLYHFSKLFKKETGLTPTQYRRQHNKRI